MCIRTYNQLMQSQESFLRKHYLYEMLIFEVYNILQSVAPNPLNTIDLFYELSPFLKARICCVMNSKTEASDLFKNKEDIVKYVADLLADKIFSIYLTNESYHYEQLEN